MSQRVRIGLLIGGLVIIAFLVMRVGPAQVIDMLGRVGWSFLIVVALYAVRQGVRAIGLWRSIVVRPPRFVDVLQVRLSGEAVEMLTYTGPFLAEPAKGWMLKRGGLPAADAFAAVATEYLLYTAASASLAIVALALLLTQEMVPNLIRPAVFVASGVLGGFIGGVIFAAVSGIGLIAPIVRASGVLIGTSRAGYAAVEVDRVERVLVSFLHDYPARVAEVLAIEAVAHALLMSEVWIVLTALGWQFSLRDLVIVEGGVKLIAMAFFFIPGQVGASEAVYVFLLQAVGLSAAAGLTLALVRRVRALVVAGADLLVLACFSDHTQPSS